MDFTTAPRMTKSNFVEFTAGDLAGVKYVSRFNGSIVAATFTEDQALNPNDTRKGVSIQNNTTGALYLWYGAVPAAAQTLGGFKARAMKLAAGGTFTPSTPQMGVLYLAADVAGFCHHLYL